jgi:hypothetical protein
MLRASHSPTAVLGLALILAQPALPFDRKIHVQITEEALAAISKNGSTLSKRAIEEIANADETVDVGDCANSGEPALPCSLVHAGALATALLLTPSNHFDNETFLAGNRILVDGERAVLDLLRQQRFLEARRRLGRTLHTLQDFYAHSNWVELGHEDLYQYAPLVLAGVRYAGPGDAVCRSDGAALLGTARYPGSVGANEKLLTSGYFYSPQSGKTTNRWMPDGKCRHGKGLIIDADSKPGINKDDPSAGESVECGAKSCYQIAYQLAVEHSRLLVDRILNDPTIQDSRMQLDGLDNVGAFKVFADRVNRTWISVRKGRTISITVSPGVVCWNTLLCAGGDPTARVGPEGVDARGFLRTAIAPPPLRNHNTGALVGRIDAAQPTSITPPGPGTTLFYVGRGGVVTVTRDGWLSLQINDADLDNNSGYFQVSVSAD